MKKIVFVINNLKTGGVQSSLLNLIQEIHDLYDVTLVSFCGVETSEAALPDNVKLVVLHSPFQYLGLAQGELKDQPFRYMARSFWAVLTKLFGRSFVIRLMLPFQRKIKTYDCAISYLHEARQKSLYGGCNEFVLKKIEAKRKLTWLHCDFELCGANSKASEKIYRRFDGIIACSEGARQSFIRCMPQLMQKCITVRNCNDYARIRQLAGDGILYHQSEFHIVTVARLSKEKGIERALIAIKKCVESGHRLHYHIVGWGDRAEYLKKLTEEYGLTQAVTFYGNQSNPYPYMKNADLFLLPSYHEAAPMVFDEAACLGVPVLATKTTSTEEMISQSNSGFVCENSQKGIFDGLMEVLDNPGILADIRKALENRLYTNEENIEKLSGVINGTCIS
jgi:glycosyltransferase involved in cell wall biosynthesis